MSSSVERNSFYRASFPKAPKFNMMLLTAELQQSESAHDYLILTYKGSIDNKSESIIEVDEPVIFNWGDGINSKEFIGYIHTIEKMTTPANTYTRIKCINNSAILKKSNKKIYKNMTSSQIVEEICKAYDIVPKTSYHPYTHTNLVQSGNSDWQLLSQLAKYTGYGLRASNTSLTFKDKDSLIHEHFNSMPYFTHFENSSGGMVQNQTLMGFTALDSAITPEFENQGDPGLVLYSNSGDRHNFDPRQSVNNGLGVKSSPNPTDNWNNDYGVN